MKGAIDLIAALDHLKQAYEHLGSLGRESGEDSKGLNLANKYGKRIKWIYDDVINVPCLPKEVTDGIKLEWNCDVFAPDAINEKILQLNPDQRDHLEAILDIMLTGEGIDVELREPELNEVN